MTTNNQMATVQIAIQETTLLALLALRQSNEESIAGVVGRLAHSQNYAHDDEEAEQAVLAVAVVEKRHKYEVTFLGQILGSDALGDMYGKLVDALFVVAPDAVAKLATMKSKSRQYVSKDALRIHPNSQHLETLRTTSGFYVSKNVGTRDFNRGLKALCEAADLQFGEDVKFQKNRGG